MSGKYNYSSAICEHCACTEYGDQPVNTGPYNMCEGVGCEQALDSYNDSVDNEEDMLTMEEAF